jgi:hypothetical protein
MVSIASGSGSGSRSRSMIEWNALLGMNIRYSITYTGDKTGREGRSWRLRILDDNKGPDVYVWRMLPRDRYLDAQRI